MEYFDGEYSASLNSEDLYDQDLPFIYNRAKGGTMVLWKSYLDPYLFVHTSESTAFLPVIIDIPNITTSIHIGLYLHTAVKEAEYLTELSKLTVALDELLLKHPNSIIYIRGDANSSKTNLKRDKLFSSFCKKFKLSRVPLNHNTYHHFCNFGYSDSELDVLLHSEHESVKECLVQLLCQEENPLVDSHHDLLVSTCKIPALPSKIVDKSENVSAPKLDNNRHRIVWS